MRLRILLEPHHGATYAQILALAEAAEAGGFDAFFRSDHYLGIDADDVTYQPTDSWTTLAGPAGPTHRGPPRRPPRGPPWRAWPSRPTGSGSARSSTPPPSGSLASSRSRSPPSPR